MSANLQCDVARLQRDMKALGQLVGTTCYTVAIMECSRLGWKELTTSAMQRTMSISITGVTRILDFIETYWLSLDLLQMRTIAHSILPRSIRLNGKLGCLLT